MSKFEVSYSENAVVFVNTKTNKAENLPLEKALSPEDSLRVIRGEQKASISASQGAVSSLCDILDNPRLGAWRGTCNVAEAVPSELKEAIRGLEKEYFTPLIVNPIMEKLGFVLTADSTPEEHTRWGKQLAVAEKACQDFFKPLKEGGSYAVAKGHVTKLFAYTGNLPKHGDKILTVSAIKKLLENIEKPPVEDLGIAGKLVALSLDLQNADADKMGDFATAIAALKSMLGTYEAYHREALETLTATIGNTELAVSIDSQAKAITANAIAKFETAPL